VLSGARDRDADDGSFIADQFLVLGTYAIAPLASYVARRREDGGVEILGRVPLPFWKRVWRAAVALPTVAVLAFFAHAYAASLSSKVHLINALDITVTVASGGESVRLAPGAREVRDLAKGRHHLVAKDERGVTLEEQDVDVPGGDVLVAYNVLGAGPIIAREIFYTRDFAAPKDLRGELILGQRTLVRENVTYPFVEPPHEIPGNADVRTWQVTQLPGGWRRAIEELREDGRQLDAIKLVEAVSLAEPENEEAALAAAFAIAERDGLDGARAHLARLSARSPGSAAVRAAEERLRHRVAP
jgi:hypothetical protein